ncbi:UPF0472 protein [Lates japonicus]|uniref:UPF0472 protein n=1 Tax=Lates japonicus TaxID=270547 RepID=A0AAD3ME90_LATJO|nr:UPF0472 protein [Lates japonicus]
MEERKEEGEAEIQEHGPEHWFSKWERQCLAEAEQNDPNEEETEQSQQKLWHLFQNSATAVAQLYKVCGSLLDIVTRFHCWVTEANINQQPTPAAGDRVRVWDSGTESGLEWPELSGDLQG